MAKTLMLGATMLSGALAQAPNPLNPNPPPVASKSGQAKPATSGQPNGKADFVMSQKPDQWLASNLKGTDVVGPDNQRIGDVTDIPFDKTGKIEAYVVSVGGFLDMGSKDVAIAPQSFDVVPGANCGANKLKLSISKDDRKEAQNFKPYQPPRPTTTGAGRPGCNLLGGGMKPGMPSTQRP